MIGPEGAVNEKDIRAGDVNLSVLEGSNAESWVHGYSG